MNDSQSAVESAVLLGFRVLVGFIFLWHGLPKVLDISFAMTKFAEFGLPGVLGPIVGAVETLAAVVLIAGIMSRWAALALAVIIIGALVTVQIPGGVSAGLERDLLILSITLFIAVRGPGRIAVQRRASEPAAGSGAYPADA